MRQAPNGVRRVGKHLLVVHWRHGLQPFADKECAGDDIGGSCWEYCGYIEKQHMHLIHHEKGDLFTGALLDEVSGQILPGGIQVSFSPDGTEYLATSQQNGKELEDWKLYTRIGKLLWAGDGGVVGPSGQIIAEFEAPKWSSDGKLLAVCVNCRYKTVYILTPDTQKRWSWKKQPESTTTLR